jgi:hypothetical protein
MREDMAMHGLRRNTQRQYIRFVRSFPGPLTLIGDIKSSRLSECLIAGMGTEASGNTL